MDIANAILKQSSKLFDKKLFTNRESSDLPALIKAIDDKEEVNYSSISTPLREHQIDLDQIAILFRNARDSFTFRACVTIEKCTI